MGTKQENSLAPRASKCIKRQIQITDITYSSTCPQVVLRPLQQDRDNFLHAKSLSTQNSLLDVNRLRPDPRCLSFTVCWGHSSAMDNQKLCGPRKKSELKGRFLSSRHAFLFFFCFKYANQNYKSFSFPFLQMILATQQVMVMQRCSEKAAFREQTYSVARAAFIVST